MTIIYDLDEIDSRQYQQVGEKAYTLSRIKRDGYPVVSSFVLSSYLFEEFLHLSGLGIDLDFLDCDDYQTLQSFAQQNRQKILTQSLPSDWLDMILIVLARLSNPTVKFTPSLFLSNYFDPRWDELLSTQFSDTNPASISLAIKKIWADLFSAKILLLFRKKNINLSEVKLAILVQSYQTPMVSGITKINSSYLTIEASWGDQLIIDRGEVLVDSYKINCSNQIKETQQLGNKLFAYRLNQSLDGLEKYLLDEDAQKSYALHEQQLEELTNLSFSLISKYTDIALFSWIIVANQLYITNLKPYLTINMTKSDSQLIVQGLGASPGVAIAPAQIIVGSHKNWQTIIPKQILILNSITPDWLPLVKKATGIITEIGGLTSHGAILARELGIPAIVGAKQITQLVQNGTLIRMNGDTGEVFLASNNESQPQLSLDTNYPYYPISTKLLLNISHRETLKHISHLPVDGVGLLRSEFFFLELFEHHSLAVWLNKYRLDFLNHLQDFLESVSQVFHPKPIFYRSINWSALELEKHLNIIKTNPEIGKTLFNLEIESILKLIKKNNYNINLILPFIRSVNEFKSYYQQIEKSGLITETSLEIWIMAEVPSVLFLLPEYIKAGVQGICIGTNDLTQFLLGVSREETSISAELTAKHPAMKKALRQLIELAQKYNIPCSICGQAPVEYPEMILELIRWGIQSISVEPRAFNNTYRAIARAEQTIILDMALRRSQKELNSKSD